MKIYTSYFYKIRFFGPNEIPISTALSDPAYFHQNKGKQYVFRDKRGVINGIRNEEMKPGAECANLCHGREGCPKTPETCDFLRTYSSQLDRINFSEFMSSLSSLLERANGNTAIFLVHEAPDNVCSERGVIQQWFKKNGIECNEWAPLA